MKKRLKMNGFLIVLAFALLVLFPGLFLRSANNGFWDDAAGISGIVLILMGQLFRASARGYKSENSGEGQLLIQGGPYSLIRNPMYLGILCVGLGMVLVLFNWWIVAAFLCIFAWRYIFLIFTEENKLSAIFGDAYKAYIRNVPRLLPSPAALLQRRVYEYLPLRAAWLKREAGSIFAVLLTVLILYGWRNIRSEGVPACAKKIALFAAIIILFVFLAAYLIRCTNNHKKDASTGRKDTL